MKKNRLHNNKETKHSERNFLILEFLIYKGQYLTNPLINFLKIHTTNFNLSKYVFFYPTINQISNIFSSLILYKIVLIRYIEKYDSMAFIRLKNIFIKYMIVLTA